MFDVKRESKIALHFRFMEYKEHVWNITHRIAGICYVAASLLIMFSVMYYGEVKMWTLPAVLILLVLPVPIGYYLSSKE